MKIKLKDNNVIHIAPEFKDGIYHHFPWKNGYVYFTNEISLFSTKKFPTDNDVFGWTEVIEKLWKNADYTLKNNQHITPLAPYENTKDMFVTQDELELVVRVNKRYALRFTRGKGFDFYLYNDRELERDFMLIVNENNIIAILPITYVIE